MTKLGILACVLGSTMAAFGWESQDQDCPPQARNANYQTRTFHSDFLPGETDWDDTGVSGFKWYVHPFFEATPPHSYSRRTLSTGVDIPPDENEPKPVTLATVTPGRKKGEWAGIAFGGGGYFEATLKFNPDAGKMGGQWPAFWSLAIEHCLFWPEQIWHTANGKMEHFIEVDFFEYDVWRFSNESSYGGAVHEWFGSYRETCKQGFCEANNANGGTPFRNFVVHTPASTNLGEFHRYGLLWIPASDKKLGSAVFFFDGTPTSDRISWTAFSDQAPPPGEQKPWTFGIIDRQHLVLMLTSGPSQQMRVQSVEVWQTSAKNNVSR